MRKIDEWHTRSVFSTGDSEFVIKIPKWNYIVNLNQFTYGLKDAQQKHDIKKLLLTIKNLWVAVSEWWRANLHEGKVHKKIQKYIAQTSFSLFGIINIQERLQVKRGKINPEPIENLMKSTNLPPFIDIDILTHTLTNRHNYWIDKKWNIKICDYGSKSVTRAIEHRGKELIDNYKTSLATSEATPSGKNKH